LRLRELLDQGRVGELRAVTGAYSYLKVEPANIRNHAEMGGGALMDIGCYLVHASRFAFGRQPVKVVATIDRDPAMRTDRLASGLMDFGVGQAVFTCGTQLIPYQRVHFLGTHGRIEIEIPFNAPPDRPTRIVVDSSGDLKGSGIISETFPIADQYTMHGEAFAKAVWEDSEPPVSLEDAIGNMAVIDALFQSASSNQWVSPEA
jgi:predicted dehydrogenase